MGFAVEGSDQVHRVKRGPKPKLLEKPVVVNSEAQDLAMRIWDGQSPDVPVIERVSRIANALKARGFSLEIELPHSEAARYLDAHK